MSIVRVGVVWVLAVLAACNKHASSGDATVVGGTTPAPSRSASVWPDGARVMVPAGATIWLDEAGTREISLPEAMSRGGLVVRVLGRSPGERIMVETESDGGCPDSGLAGLRLRVWASADALTEVGEQPCPAATEPKPRGTATVSGGSDVFWRDGTKAGTLPRAREVFGAVIAAGARSCFPFALAPGDELTLCFPKDAIGLQDVVGLGSAGPIPQPAIDTPEMGTQPVEIDGLVQGGLLGGEIGGEPGSFSGVFGGEIGGEIGGVPGGVVGGVIGGVPGGSEKKGRRPVPVVRQAKAVVVGKLDREIVRRIVRAHLNEVRACYTARLVDTPKLAGRLTIAFTIEGDGTTRDARVQKSTLGNAQLGFCVVERIARWKFPKSEDGKPVVVAYPFILEPGG